MHINTYTFSPSSLSSQTHIYHQWSFQFQLDSFQKIKNLQLTLNRTENLLVVDFHTFPWVSNGGEIVTHPVNQLTLDESQLIEWSRWQAPLMPINPLPINHYPLSITGVTLKRNVTNYSKIKKNEEKMKLERKAGRGVD